MPAVEQAMNSSAPAARPVRAGAQRGRAERKAATRPPSWRERLGRHRLALFAGGGLAGGLALAMVSPGHWGRAGALLLGGAASLTRSPIGPALFGVLLVRFLGRSGARRRRAGNDARSATGETTP
jgi:hypothetical protein